MELKLSGRLEEIMRYGVPHIVEKGNALNRKADVVGIYDGVIPEVAFFLQEDNLGRNLDIVCYMTN